MVGRVRHAEADSRNPLTGVVSQHTTVSGWETSAGSASVCGMSAFCLKRMEALLTKRCRTAKTSQDILL